MCACAPRDTAQTQEEAHRDPLRRCKKGGVAAVVMLASLLGGLVGTASALAIAVPALDRPLTVSEATSFECTHDETGGKIWDSGRLLSSILADDYGLLDKHVVELGSGTGIGGLTAAAAGAASVWLTDGSTAVLPLLEANVKVNGLEDIARVQRLRWGSDADAEDDLAGLERERPSTTPNDLLIGSDLLYAPEIFPDLLETLVRLCTPEHTEVLLTFPTRFTEGIFLDMAERDFGFECIDKEEREPALWKASLILRES